MVKLTPELIEEARIFVNPCSDRELDLRNYKIPALENLGTTYNQFDNIDLTDNDLRRLENLPQLPRLKSLFLSNNRISFVDPQLGDSVRNLRTLVLTNNNMAELGDLEGLGSLSKLEYVSLLGNPVSKKPDYRLFLIQTCPSLRVLDFQRIREKERVASKARFKGKKGRDYLSRLASQRSHGAAAAATPAPDAAPAHHANGATQNAADVERIREAIAKAGSLAEVENLQELLKAGQIPGNAPPSNGQAGSGGADEPETEDMED